MLKTRKSNQAKPPIVLIYGVEGAGKSTLGSKAPKPIFVSPESGTDRLTTSDNKPVDEMPNLNSFSDVRSAIKMILKEEHDFKTLVIDSADWIEKLCHAEIVGTSGKTIITVGGGYGSGYRQSEQLHRELISDLSEIREKRNMNIVITAHSTVRQAKDPDSAHDYDTFEIKLQEMVSSLYREWVEALLFVRFKTFTKTSDDTDKARALGTDERIIYTVKRPAFQAKNRFGLPSEMSFKLDFWNEFMKYASKGCQEEEVQSLLSLVKDEELKKKILIAIKNTTNMEPIIKRLKEITK